MTYSSKKKIILDNSNDLLHILLSLNGLLHILLSLNDLLNFSNIIFLFSL